MPERQAWSREIQVKNFYPVFDRKGLIIDVRHNRGGEIRLSSSNILVEVPKHPPYPDKKR